jgi:hypothetical protein
MDYQRTGASASQAAIVDLSRNAAYAPDTAPLAWTRTADRSREVAYTILSYIDAELVGEPPRARRRDLVDQMYEHMRQWFVQFCWKGQGAAPGMPAGPCPDGALTQFSPFMVGLTAHSIIRDWEQTGDSRALPALEMAADWLMNGDADVPTPYDTTAHGWFYDAVNAGAGAGTGAPDLNLLIAPMYAFLYRQTGDPAYLAMGDQAFGDGVQHACAGCNGKHFDQSYWWSFDYVRWRSAAYPGLSLAIASPAPGSTVSGIATVAVTASGSAPVTTLTYHLDGMLLGAVSPPAPVLSGDSSLIPNGAHTLTVTAVDAAGRVEQAAVAFTVANPPGP